MPHPSEYAPGQVVFYRDRQLTKAGRVGETFERFNEEEKTWELVTPVENLRKDGEIDHPVLAWENGDEFRQLVASGKIKIGEKKEKVKRA